MEEKSVFRKASLDRVSSPEQLNDYLHVTSPKVWIFLAAVILLLGSLFAWSAATAAGSYIETAAEARDGILILPFEGDDMEKASHVEVGMLIYIGTDYSTPVTSVGIETDGPFIVWGQTNLPDGTYMARVQYKSTQIISLLFN